MKAVSSVVGAAIAIVLIIMVMLAFNSYYSSLNRVIARELQAVKEDLKIIPYINGSSIYFSVVNPGPIDPVIVRYIIVKNISDGRILWIRELWRRLDVGDSMDFLLFNTTDVRGRIDIIAVTSNGGVFHMDPEYTGGDGLLDPADIDALLTNAASEAIATDFFINPSIGWAFNKSIIIRDGSGTLYYFIPYSVGNESWSSTVAYADYNTFYSGTVSIVLKDNSNGKYINKLKGVFASDLSYVDAYLVYTDGTQKYLGRLYLGDTVTKSVSWSGSGSITVSYGSFNITYRVTLNGISSITLKYDGTTEASWLRLSTDDYTVYRYIKVSAVDKVYIYVYYNDWPYLVQDNYLLDVGEDTGFLFLGTKSYYSYGTTVWMDDDWPSRTNSAYIRPRDSFSFSLFYVVNPSPSYTVSINVPYVSYDAYQPSMSGSAVSQYIRPSDQVVGLSYDNYLLPGSRTISVNATVPEIYKLIIGQPDPNLPSYMIFIAWLDPRLVVNITDGGDELLVKYGLVRTGATIAFLYDSVVFYGGDLLGVFVNGTSISLSKGVYAIVPMKGPLVGNVFYIWVDDWSVISS